VVQQTSPWFRVDQQIEVIILVGDTASYRTEYPQAVGAALGGNPEDFLAALRSQCIERNHFSILHAALLKPANQTKDGSMLICRRASAFQAKPPFAVVSPGTSRTGLPRSVPERRLFPSGRRSAPSISSLRSVNAAPLIVTFPTPNGRASPPSVALDYWVRRRRISHSPRAERIKVKPPSPPSAQSVQTKKKPPGDWAISP
jgi:hypothetical protein